MTKMSFCIKFGITCVSAESSILYTQPTLYIYLFEIVRPSLLSYVTVIIAFCSSKFFPLVLFSLFLLSMTL